MSIPEYQDFMLPLLRAVADGGAHRLRELVGPLADAAGVSADEKELLLPSGQNTFVNNRVQWAKTYLKKAGLLEQPQRGFIRITATGRAVLDQQPNCIDTDYLRRFPTFVDFVDSKHERHDT